MTKETLFLAHFWPISPIFWAKNFLMENPALPHTTSYWFLESYQILEKNNHTIPRRRWDGRTDRRTDRPYFTGPFQLMLGVQKIVAVTEKTINIIVIIRAKK